MLRMLLLAGEGENNGWTSYVIMAVLLLAIVGMFIWTTISNKKRQKAEAQKREQIRIGDRIKTIGGICGYLVEVNDAENTIVLETGSGDNKSYVKFDRQAIYQTAPATTAAPAPAVEEKKEEVVEEVKAEEKKEEPAKKKTSKKKEKE